MAEHHLPPEPVGRKGGVHADDLTRGRRRYTTYYYGYNGGGGAGRALCFALLVLLLAAGITWLVLYVVYRPSHPTLSVTSAAVLALYNATPTTSPTTDPTAVAASFQFTLVLRNPSARSAARYDRLTAYAAYRGEPLTPPAPLPPLAQDAGDAVAVAPVLGGQGQQAVPVSPETAAALAADAAYGVLAIRVVVLGRVRFVSGPFHRGWHSMYARCDVLLGLRKASGGGDGRNGGGAGGGGVQQQAALLGEPACNVDM